MDKIFLKDIAKELGLSKTTISLVLNDRGDEVKISKKTQERIKKYAKEHNYVPNQLARGLVRGKSDSIGLIIPNISNPFYAEIAGFLEKEAQKHGFIVIYSSTYENQEKEKGLIHSMLNRQVDGLIIASTQKNIVDVKALQKSKIPFVLIDRHYPVLDTNYVIVDNYGGVKNAVEHLLSLNRKRIGFITLKMSLDAIKERLRGFEETLKANDISMPPSTIIQLKKSEYRDKMGEVMERIVKSDKVDALIFATHDLTASGLRELKKLNVKIPDDIAILSFDEMAAFDLIEPPITSIQQPTELMSKEALSILLAQIKNKSHLLTSKEVLETELVIRKSCGS